MGASNFARLRNASTIFVVGERVEEKFSECDCGKHYEWEDEYVGEVYSTCPICETEVSHDEEYRQPESWEWDDIESNIGDMLSKIDGFYETKSELGKIERHKIYGDCEIIVRFIPSMKSGYYEAAQLDYEIEIETYSVNLNYLDDDMDDILEYAFSEYHSDLNRGLVAIHTKNARKWLESTIESVSEQIEKVFSDHSSSKLQRVGGFSDGTSVYKPVN